MIGWLWDAPGPDRSGCGVSGDEGRARRAAEEFLRGGADTARVESAAYSGGADVLTPCWRRTGNGVQARLFRGRIRWDPLAPGT